MFESRNATARRRQPCVELLGLQRARDSVPLTDVASHLDGTIHHLVVLDAFGDDPQAEIVTQMDGGSHDHVIVGFEEDVGDEAAVDLQFRHQASISTAATTNPALGVITSA